MRPVWQNARSALPGCAARCLFPIPPCPATTGCLRMADLYGHLPRGPAGVLRAAKWSMLGLRAAWLHESSFRLEVCLFAVLGPLGWFLGDGGVERALLIGSCLPVMAMELMNSSIE